ncbi:MAG: hypothetical protein GX428_02725 [Candidatus Atribacteria bacterium]|nr:hypothetical protein [Candidatus Atribacteria bacterium]
MNSREFWNEAKDSFRLLIRRPSFILTTAVPALIFSLILSLTPVRRLVWISSYFQSFTLAGLGLAGMFTMFLGMCFLIALVWDYQYRSIIDFRRVYRIIQSRYSDVLFACLGLGLLIGFFSVWFVFAGFFLAFLLIFCLPAIVIRGDDPFSAIKTSFHMVYDNLAEVFAFFILALALFVIGYVLVWLIRFIPLVGIFINIIFIASLLAYVGTLLTRFYLRLTRY